MPISHLEDIFFHMNPFQIMPYRSHQIQVLQQPEVVRQYKAHQVFHHISNCPIALYCHHMWCIRLHNTLTFLTAPKLPQQQMVLRLRYKQHQQAMAIPTEISLVQHFQVSPNHHCIRLPILILAARYYQAQLVMFLGFQVLQEYIKMYK